MREVSALDRIERICGGGLDERALRAAVLDELRTVVPFDAYAWLLTDPESCVGSAPLAEIPDLADLPALVRLKYLTATNRWTHLPGGAAVTLVEATGGDRSRSAVWHGLLARYGVEDVLSTVFKDRHGCWGFLDLWRRQGTFAARERELLASAGRVTTAALRRSLATTFSLGAGPSVGSREPALLLLSDTLVPRTQTPQADAYLRTLLPTDAAVAPVPAGAFNVAAQLLAQEAGVDDHPPWARVHLRDGLWVTLRAARTVAGESIAVSIEPATAAQRAALYARVVGLTERETQLLHHLVAGHDTRELARRLFLSEHTVQDHLKSVFAKTGAGNRRVLVARATGAG